MTCSRFVFLVLGALSLAACEDIYPPTPRPDYTIKVAPTEKGAVAIPPTCPSWADAVTNPMDNQPLPQFGCATARILASSIENPKDLAEGRTLAPERGVHAVGEVRRYDNDQTRSFIMPAAEDSTKAVTTMSTDQSALTGDITGSAGGGSSSSSSSSSAASALGASMPTP